jgi:hypothetical protein
VQVYIPLMHAESVKLDEGGTCAIGYSCEARGAVTILHRDATWQ